MGKACRIRHHQHATRMQTVHQHRVNQHRDTCWLHAFCSIDLRSLAALRIALGTLILVDILFQRWPALGAHYAGGLFSIEALTNKSAEVGWYWSFHHWFSNPLGLHTLFALQSILAIALIIGWRTWFIAPANWLLLASLQTANFYVLDGGDALLRLLLLFGSFLPLGARWSIDDYKSKKSCTTSLPNVFLPGALCLMLQVASIYWFSLFFKTDPMWTQTFDVLHYAFHFPLYAKGLAKALQDFPTLLQGLSLGAYIFELVGPLLVLASYRRPKIRLAGILCFWIFHAGIFLTMGIELLSFTCMAAWLIFLPPWFWEQLGLKSKETSPLPTPNSGILTAQAIAVLFFLISLLGNAMTANGQSLNKLPSPFNRFATFWMLNQNWGAFSHEDGLSLQAWLSIEGQTDSGAWINIMTGEPASDTVPENARDHYPNERWRRSTLALSRTQEANHWPQLVQYYAEQWNTHAPPGDIVHQVRFVLYYAKTNAPGTPPDSKIQRVIKYQSDVE